MSKKDFSWEDKYLISLWFNAVITGLIYQIYENSLKKKEKLINQDKK